MISRRWAVFAALSALASCSSRNPALYTLSAVPGPVHAAKFRTVLLHQVSVARYLERDQIVRSSEESRLDLRANDWWGEPLAPMLGRVLVENLSQRLPKASVFSAQGAIDLDAEASVSVNLLRLDLDRSGGLVLSAQVAVSRPGQRGSPATQTVRASIPAGGPEVADEVAAMNQALGQLADAIAGMLAR